MESKNTEEVWKNIDGYEGLYQVSNLGRVRSLDRVVTYRNGVSHPYKGKILVPVKYNGLYLQVYLGRGRHKTIHRLVATAFVFNPKPGIYNVINHKDENPSNNRWDNLEWCTQGYNLWYGSNCNRNSYKRKPVEMLDLKGNFLRKFCSIKSAAAFINVLPSSVGNCIKGRLYTCGGYKWRFSNE